jgi:hypothetical protein
MSSMNTPVAPVVRARPLLSTTNFAMIAVAVATSLNCVASASAQSRESMENAFQWSGTVAQGRTMMIRNINGAIRVEHSNSGKVEVNAEKQWRRGNPADVRIEQPRVSGGNVMICALWGPDATCDEDGIHTPRRWNNNNNNDVSVNFVVRVPDGVRVDISTVNGGLDVNGVTTEVLANTVNGAINAKSAGGPVRAKTVNGSINVSMGTARSSEDLSYETVNGSVTLELPSNFGAQLELSTVNGRVTTDFPITVVGTLSPRRLRGTIGDGSMHMRASTVNGSVTLRRSN